MKKSLLLICLFLYLVIVNTPSSAQPELFGMTSGGINDFGGIFSIKADGTNQMLHKEYGEISGANPEYSKLCKASNGKLYGMSRLGGLYTKGVIFEYDIVTSQYLKKYDFGNGYNGKEPFGSLIQAGNGKLYGMTFAGGVNDLGVLFEFDPVTNSYSKLLDFDGIAKGSKPFGSLVESINGKLYGLTSKGGTKDYGVLFEFDINTSSYVKKLDFSGAANGINPIGSMLQASDGKLYGMTRDGGLNDKGVIFEFDPMTGIFKKKFDFSGTANGANPWGSLIQAVNGKLYGMTYRGGVGNIGVLFEYEPIGNSFTKLLDFDQTINGSYPYSDLMQAADGLLYGLTSRGGANDDGVLFAFNISSNSFNNRHNFEHNTDGHSPRGSIIQAGNGKMYGMTHSSTNYGKGVLFEFDPVGNSYSMKLQFSAALDGASPFGSLFQADDGKFYGLTRDGGTVNNGTLFEYDPITKVYLKRVDFPSGMIEESAPTGSLIQTANGKLYGLTGGGGTKDLGTLFEYDPVTHVHIVRVNFGGNEGMAPTGSLVEAQNGRLYGVTFIGTAGSKGVLFEFDPSTNICTKKVDFTGAANGSMPLGGLMKATNGKLYGMTTYGGSNDLGVLYEYDISANTLVKLYDFVKANGSSPSGELMQASNGKLYGLTAFGGAANNGVLFEYDLSNNTFTNKMEFDGNANGGNPRGSLMQASNGKLYGMTRSGGTFNLGVVFEYDHANDTYDKLLDFDGENGAYPFYGKLVEVKGGSNSIAKRNAERVSNIKVYQSENYLKIALVGELGNIKEVKVYDLTGRLVLQDNSIIGNAVTLDASTLKVGVYTVGIRTDLGIKNVKLYLGR